MQPHCLKASDTVYDMMQIKKKFGYTGAPITETGKVGSKLLGMITSRDFDFIETNPDNQKQMPITDVSFRLLDTEYNKEYLLSIKAQGKNKG